jgi:NhaP-type Na+/H+ and K+/H+ antiporter
VIALIVRPIVLYPMLAGLNLNTFDRRLIAVFGPRGLSSLLLALLAVFAGVSDAGEIFRVTSVVVLLSVVVHGGLTAYFLRKSAARGVTGPAKAPAPLSRSASVATPAPVKPSPVAADSAPRITIEEMQALQAKGEPVVVVDARSNRSYDGDTLIATGAVRLQPDDPVRDATEKRLSQRANLVVYCA